MSQNTLGKTVRRDDRPTAKPRQADGTEIGLRGDSEAVAPAQALMLRLSKAATIFPGGLFVLALPVQSFCRSYWR